MQYGRYQIVAELGRGSMGVVYKAHDPQIDRVIALKVLREDRVASEDFVRRFLKEAMAVGRLSHPGIVTVYDVGQDHGSIYIAMEFLQGTPLDSLMAEKKFSLPEIVDIGRQIAQALHYAHQHGIVHRDIKPPNIIYSPQGSIRVTDFGIARIEDPTGHNMTQVGEILGTPLYMSPEQIMGHPLDGRSDYFSLGVILYQLTTGRRPFLGETLAAIFRAITQDTPEPPQRLDPAIPKPLSDLIMKLLAKESVQRFADGEELIHALGNCLQTQQVPVGKRGKKVPVTGVAGRSRGLTVAGIALVLFLLGVGGGAYYYLQHSPPPTSVSEEDQGQASHVPPGVSSQSPAQVSQESLPPVDPADRAALKDGAPFGKPPGDHYKIKGAGLPDPGVDERKAPASTVVVDRPKASLENKILAGSQAVLKMDSRPQGAELFIDGSRAGTTPVTITITAAKHEVKLQMKKHLGWEAQLDLSKGGEVPVLIQLLPESTPNP